MRIFAEHNVRIAKWQYVIGVPVSISTKPEIICCHKIESLNLNFCTKQSKIYFSFIYDKKKSNIISF